MSKISHTPGAAIAWGIGSDRGRSSQVLRLIWRVTPRRIGRRETRRCRIIFSNWEKAHNRKDAKNQYLDRRRNAI